MRTAVAALVATAAVALSGCETGRLPAVGITPVASPLSAACTRFHEALPDDLGDDVPRRDTAPERTGVAAYGEPPIVVRCGAPSSVRYKQGEPLYDVNGVDWYAEEHPGHVVWTTPRAFTNVEVVIPRAWTGDRLSFLTEAVNATR